MRKKYKTLGTEACESIDTLYIKKNKSLAYSSQGSHKAHPDFCNWLADGRRTW